MAPPNQVAVPAVSAAATIPPIIPLTLGTEMVDLFVGPQKTLLRVHKVLLCQKIPYFAKMFQGGFKEATDNFATFPEDNREEFDLLIEWVYTGKIRGLENNAYPNIRTQISSWALLPFYTLAEKLCLTSLKDGILDVYRHNQTKNNSIHAISYLKSCWKDSFEGSEVGRYMLDSLVYIFMELKQPKELEIWSTSDILDLAFRHQGLSKLAFEAIRQHTHAGTKPKDPRKIPNCEYHSHGKDEPCLAEKSA
ncbi:hypothetical protein LSUE1_G006000 [Lachnellula suecica]|uniref:BTB domain-containing protein n=1 Tax=Lachnellula suecica TaxID=602035 RepID=A0A8T9C7R9_9HELO|nr:hypothetical protein LSUE1_G006000 [Lachnellula suecica]